MARYFVLGNGSMLVCLDQYGRIRDFYYPYVGQENHVNGKKHMLGVWVDGTFSWFASENWERTIGYAHESLVLDISGINEQVQLELHLKDIVHNQNVYIRSITVTNNADREREVRVFCHQIFQISEANLGDTVYFHPKYHALVYYKGRRYFMVNGCYQINDKRHGLSGFTTGLFEFNNEQGSFKDAEDGVLESNPIKHGSVDSVVSFTFKIPANSSQELYYWITAGETLNKVAQINDMVLERSPQVLIQEAHDHWNKVVNQTPFQFKGLSKPVIKLFKESLMIIQSHVDKSGSIIASSDSDILYYNRDTYAYMWPRDGALIVRSLDRAGYRKITEQFFKFCCDAVTPEGYFLHKYRPDGSLGSSWHPWIYEGKFQLPIQEDQIALVLDALWKHFSQHQDEDYARKIYECFIHRAGGFLLDFFDKETNLPKQSYDLWEEKLGVHTFTCSTVYAAFKACAQFEEVFGTPDRKQIFLNAASKLKKAIVSTFYDEKLGYFIKRIYYEQGELKRDTIFDASSAYGVFQFGVLEPTDPRVVSSMEHFHDKINVKTDVGGFSRYEHDMYYRVVEDVPGNPWFIISLWLAEYYIACAKNEQDLQPAREIFEWVVSHSFPTGVLSEQLHPHTGAPLSVAPLTWSHAGYVIAINKYLEKMDELGICKMCNPGKDQSDTLN